MKLTVEWLKAAMERVAFWWYLHGGWSGIWNDIVQPFRTRWELFMYRRRKRNPELVELDAFRELVFLEDRLKEYPRAIPLLAAALKDYEITEQKAKAIDIMHRLRKVDPSSKRPEPQQLCEIPSRKAK